MIDWRTGGGGGGSGSGSPARQGAKDMHLRREDNDKTKNAKTACTLKSETGLDMLDSFAPAPAPAPATIASGLLGR